jgi:hypothetical protein
MQLSKIALKRFRLSHYNNTIVIALLQRRYNKNWQKLNRFLELNQNSKNL